MPLRKDNLKIILFQLVILPFLFSCNSSSSSSSSSSSCSSCSSCSSSSSSSSSSDSSISSQRQVTSDAASGRFEISKGNRLLKDKQNWLLNLSLSDLQKFCTPLAISNCSVNGGVRLKAKDKGKIITLLNDKLRDSANDKIFKKVIKIVAKKHQAEGLRLWNIKDFSEVILENRGELPENVSNTEWENATKSPTSN
jgi:hypothetical protein